MLAKRIDLTHEIAFKRLLMSPAQRTVISLTFPIVSCWMKLAATVSEAHIAIAQYEFWNTELTLLEQKRQPHHPLSLQLKPFLNDVNLSICRHLKTTLEAFLWMAIQQPLSSERDYTTFCTKLSSYMIPLFLMHETSPLQQHSHLELRLLTIKVQHAQWWGWDKERLLSVYPHDWQSCNPVLMSAQTHLKALHKIGTTHLSHLEYFMFLKAQALHKLLLQHQNQIDTQYIDLSYPNLLKILFKSYWR